MSQDKNRSSHNRSSAKKTTAKKSVAKRSPDKKPTKADALRAKRANSNTGHTPKGKKVASSRVSRRNPKPSRARV